MFLLILGLLLFAGAHLYTAVPAWRAPLVARLGEWPYKGLFSLVSLLGLVLMGAGYGRAESALLWTPPRFGHELAAALMPLASVLIVAAYVPSNIKRLTAHPMLWGVVLWALAHLLVRGHGAALLLFGGLGVYALLAMALAHQRGVRPSAEPRPFWLDAVAIGGGLALYALLLILHPVLFGVAVIG